MKRFILLLAILALTAGCQYSPSKSSSGNIENGAINTDINAGLNANANQTSTSTSTGFKTYQGNGYTFKYPNNWMVTTRGSAVYTSNPDSSGRSFVVEATTTSLTQFIKENNISETTRITSNTRHTLDGVNVTKLTQSTDLGLTSTILFIPRDDGSLVVSYHDFNNDHVQLLSTFDLEN